MNRIIIIACLLFLMAMSPGSPKPTLYIIGDSTASIYTASRYPRTGWAQVLQDSFIRDSVEVVDKALSGRSSKSFFDEGHWSPVKSALREGDYVIIQFGHNDEKTGDASRGTLPGSTFEYYLSIYIDDALKKGAVPVLATPIVRNSWQSSTELKSTHVTSSGDYPQAIRDLAADKNIDLIDATLLTKNYFESVGKNSTTKLFMNLAAGESPNYPEGNRNNTHLQERGAKIVSRLIADDIMAQQLHPLSTWLPGGVTGQHSPHGTSISRPAHRSPQKSILHISTGTTGRILSNMSPLPVHFTVFTAAGRVVTPTTHLESSGTYRLPSATGALLVRTTGQCSVFRTAGNGDILPGTRY